MRTKLISAPYTIWMTLFIIVPMGLVAFFAFTDKSGAFTLDNIARVGQYSNVFLRSIWLGALATFISLLLGYPLAYTIAKAAPNRQSFLILLIMLPMWMNFLLRTYAWMSLLEDNGLINNMLAAVGLPRITTRIPVVLNVPPVDLFTFWIDERNTISACRLATIRVKNSLFTIRNGISCDMLWNMPTTAVLYDPIIPAPDTSAVIACISARLTSPDTPTNLFAPLYTLKLLMTSGKVIFPLSAIMHYLLSALPSASSDQISGQKQCLLQA